MPLMSIRLELGRDAGFPNGDSTQGYEFVAPLTADGHLDSAAWARNKAACKVWHFKDGRADEVGLLRHIGQGWRFDYDANRQDDDEPFFKLDRHAIAPGLYLSITGHDGVRRPFKVVAVTPVSAEQGA